MFPRLSDWLLERRIAQLGRDLRATARAIDDAQREYALVYVELRNAIAQRPAGQAEHTKRACL